jgi:hypothetical protein
LAFAVFATEGAVRSGYEAAMGEVSSHLPNRDRGHEEEFGKAEHCEMAGIRIVFGKAIEMRLVDAEPLYLRLWLSRRKKLDLYITY